MKKLFLSLTAILLVVGLSNTVVAQATDDASATATIVTPITITKTVDMSFGNVAVSASLDGTVILATDGTRSSTGGVTLPNVTGTVSAASFDVEGEGDYTYAITLPSTDHVITHTNNTDEMIVNSFTSDPSGTGTLSSGAQTLTVGATLEVTQGQEPGVYTSLTNFDVTVNYN